MCHGRSAQIISLDLARPSDHHGSPTLSIASTRWPMCHTFRAWKTDPQSSFALDECATTHDEIRPLADVVAASRRHASRHLSGCTTLDLVATISPRLAVWRRLLRLLPAVLPRIRSLSSETVSLQIDTAAICRGQPGIAYADARQCRATRSLISSRYPQPPPPG